MRMTHQDCVIEGPHPPHMIGVDLDTCLGALTAAQHPSCTIWAAHRPHALADGPAACGGLGARVLAAPTVEPAQEPKMAQPRSSDERPRIVASNRIIEALIVSGVIEGDESMVTRVIIDLKAHEVPVIHVEKVGDERLLHLVRTLDEVRIERGA